MRFFYTILLSLWIASNTFAFDFDFKDFYLGETSRESKKNINPYFKDFFTGQKLNQIRQVLMGYQTVLLEEDTKSFRMDVPLFLYLSMVLQNQNLSIDIQKERVYLDEVHFIDFKDETIRKKDYDFFYEKDFYYLAFNQIKTYKVSHPTRINPNLRDIRFKFFKDTLYCIEYKAHLKPHQMNRVRQNYQENFGISLSRKETTFSTDRGLYVVQIKPKKEEMRFLLMNRPLYNQIEKYIEEQMTDMIKEISKLIENKLNLAVQLKELLLQEKKKILKEKIQKVYRFIDDF